MSKAVFKPGQSAKKQRTAAGSSAVGGSARKTASHSSSGGGDGSAAAARKKSLAQSIAEMSNPTPKDFDPEDLDNGGLASARVSASYDDDAAEDDSAPRLLSERSHIRKNFDVEDVSEEYKGRVVSRKQLAAQDFGADMSDEAEDDDQEEEGEDAEEGEDEEAGEDDEDAAEQMEDAEEEDEDAEDDGEDEEDQSEQDGDEEEASGTAGMMAKGLSDQQRLVQQQLAALEEEEEAGASLFQPRGAAAGSVTSSSATSQYTKSVHIKNQLAWYTHLLNLRIRVQGVLANANRLPPTVLDAEAPAAAASDPSPSEVRSAFESASDEVAPAYASAFRGARKLLDDLFELQHGLMAQNKKIFAANAATQGDDEDEEQQEDEEGGASIPKWTGAASSARKRKRNNAADGEDEDAADGGDDDDADTELAPEDVDATLGSYWSFLSEQVTPFWLPLQNALIDKWNTKTQLGAGHVAALTAGSGAAAKAGTAAALGGLKVINQSVLSQIEQLMMDQERLVKRSQMHRAAAAAGGEGALIGRVAAERTRQSKARSASASDPDSVDALTGRAAVVDEYDASIYDDNDHYQQLLAEIISAANASALDGAGGGADHDADLVAKAAQAARRKGRKGAGVVDRRASKGRKMRYTVHAKLANFMAPRPAPISDDYAARSGAGEKNANLLMGSGFAMDELFMNLFGGQGKITQTRA